MSTQRSERWMYRSAGPNWRIQVNSSGYMYLSGNPKNVRKRVGLLLQHQFTLRALAPPSLRPAAAAMPRYAAESVVPLARAPRLRPLDFDAGQLHRGLPAGPGVGPRRVSCIPARDTRRTRPAYPPLSQWPPAAFVSRNPLLPGCCRRLRPTSYTVLTPYLFGQK